MDIQFMFVPCLKNVINVIHCVKLIIMADHAGHNGSLNRDGNAVEVARLLAWEPADKSNEIPTKNENNFWWCSYLPLRRFGFHIGLSECEQFHACLLLLLLFLQSRVYNSSSLDLLWIANDRAWYDSKLSQLNRPLRHWAPKNRPTPELAVALSARFECSEGRAIHKINSRKRACHEYIEVSASVANTTDLRRKCVVIIANYCWWKRYSRPFDTNARPGFPLEYPPYIPVSTESWLNRQPGRICQPSLWGSKGSGRSANKARVLMPYWIPQESYYISHLAFSEL